MTVTLSTFSESLKKKIGVKTSFPLGARVTLSQGAIESGRFRKEQKGGRKIEGSVVGLSNDPDCIRVLVDGRKCAIAWHVAFWTPI